MAFLKIKTESVKLIQKEKSGTDGFGMPTYTETTAEVPGVLVETVDSQDTISSTDITGKKISYKLHIPKGDTHTWTDTTVYVRGQKCRTAGFAEEYINPPLDWNLTIRAEHYE